MMRPLAKQDSDGGDAVGTERVKSSSVTYFPSTLEIYEQPLSASFETHLKDEGFFNERQTSSTNIGNF